MTSVPERTAQAIEAAGWTVGRNLDGAPRRRRLHCMRPGGEVLVLVWERNDRNRDVLVTGEYYHDGGQFTAVTVAQALKIAAQPSVQHLAALPDAEALAVLAGRTLTWTNSFTGKSVTAALPRGGVHLKLADGVLSFASADGGGFRTVRLTAITKIA